MLRQSGLFFTVQPQMNRAKAKDITQDGGTISPSYTILDFTSHQQEMHFVEASETLYTSTL